MNSTKISCALNLLRLALLAAAIPLGVVRCLAAEKDRANAVAGFPETVISTLNGGQRFRDPAYFRLMAGDGLRSVDPQVLYARLQVAVHANERYKALYFATIFTELQPSLPTGWSNRATLAASFGLTTEAELCRKNAAYPAHPQTVNSTMLPGAALKYEPVSLADWAAALALVSDSVAEREGSEALIAFPDDVSGIHEATQQEIEESNAALQSSGLPPTGPWADAQPVRLQDILANAFSLRSGQPMSYRFQSRSSAFGAGLIAALSSVVAQSNPTLAEAGLETAQDENSQGSQMPSHYSGGSYLTTAYKDDAQILDTKKPHSSGEDHAVGAPIPLLPASGGSFNPIYAGRWVAGEKPLIKRITASDLKSGKPVEWRERRPPDTLFFPKLITLCAATCAQPATLTELLLTDDDVLALSPSLYAAYVRGCMGVGKVDFLRSDFRSGQIRVGGSFGERQFIAFDDHGDAYILRWGPAEWLVPVGRN